MTYESIQNLKVCLDLTDCLSIYEASKLKLTIDYRDTALGHTFI